jgi:rare lipoprotein A
MKKLMVVIIIVIVLGIFLSSCRISVFNFFNKWRKEGREEIGIASWYGPGFQGKKTANGERYDMRKMTAAHKTLPFDTLVRVTNLENGHQAKVRINDRGPFVRGRIIDLSRKAARTLYMYKKGTARVKVEVLKWGDGKYKKNR